MEKLVSQRRGRERRREGRIGFGGKVSAPVGVSSRVQSLWLGKEEEEGRERAGSAAVWNMCRLDVYTHSARLLKSWTARLTAP